MSDITKRAHEIIKRTGIDIEKKKDYNIDKTLKRLEALEKGIKDRTFKIIFAFDTTGSMYHCIEKVRGNIEKVVDEILTKEKDINVMVAGVGEYCDTPYTLQMTSYSNNPSNLRTNINSIKNTDGGGPCQVSLELLFQELNRKYISGIDNVLVVVTDQIAHGQDNSVPYPRADYRKELFDLKKHLKGFYLVSCSDDNDIVYLQKQLINPEDPNERFIRLSEFDILTELLIALTKRSISDDKFDDYMKRLEQSADTKNKIAAKKIKGYLT